ncbi:MAG: phosphate/phosphite/phosphonate ABC transporter substrate-binding protein [Gammaproteobacteria bacterium]|nr:phosphate/phosphite/phosphonate ABC transporter substrate-binding protein [Gammaproteobacteria bacterium]
MCNLNRFVSLTLTLLLCVTVSGRSAADAVKESSTQYGFGVVPQFSALEIVAIWRPILNELEHMTGLRFRLSGSDSIPAFEKEFTAGRFDFVYMNPYHFVHAQRSQGYRPLVRDVGRTLFGILVVARESQVDSIDQLHGQVVAFPSPNALGASLLPRAQFLREKIEIKPLYVRSHSSVYLNVALGKAVAGGGVQKTLEQQPQQIQDALRVIYRTQEVVSHPIAVHPRVPEELKERVTTALLALGQTGSGREMLAKVPMERIGPASSDDYRALQALGLDHLVEDW